MLPLLHENMIDREECGFRFYFRYLQVAFAFVDSPPPHYFFFLWGGMFYSVMDHRWEKKKGIACARDGYILYIG